MLKKLDKFHKTTAGYLLFGFFELGLAYLFVSLAIDQGNFLYYFLTLVLLVGALNNFVKLLGKVFHGRKAKPHHR